MTSEERLWVVEIDGIDGGGKVTITRRMGWATCGSASYESIKYAVQAYLTREDKEDKHLPDTAEYWDYQDGGFASAQAYALKLASWVMYAVADKRTLLERQEAVLAAYELYSGSNEGNGG